MTRAIIVVGLCALVACAAPDEVNENMIGQPALTMQQRHDRLALIRDSAREVGVFNAALIGGIAISETNLAHCYDEVSFGCPGPASPSCNGGPVIAGGADGPCSDMQGGLGMFQFDAGTYAQTISTYGEAILTVEGNTAQVVAFLVERMKQSVDGITDWMSAVDYINAIPLEAGNPVTDGWGAFLACRYNGCCSQSATCIMRGNKYRDNGIDLYAEMGADFWRTADACSELPADGMIDTRSACYLAGGDPRYWHREATGYGDASEWTNTTANAAPSNFARWKVPPIGAARVRIEAYASGGEATAATYSIVVAGATETVTTMATIDQSTSSGFVVLAEIDVAGDGTEYVQLGDNTGMSGQKLVFDAVRLTVLDDVELPPPGDDGGCGCGAGGGRGVGVGSLVVALLLRRRRSRR
jgi:hypothetical protein